MLLRLPRRRGKGSELNGSFDVVRYTESEGKASRHVRKRGLGFVH